MKLQDLSPFKFARLGSHALRDLGQGLDRYIQGKLWAKILFALALGVLAGYLLGEEVDLVNSDLERAITNWAAVPGQIFLSLIKLVVIPLVFASVVLGIIGSDSIQTLKSLGLKTLLFYISTTVISVVIGFAVAFIVKPGRFIDSKLISKLEVSKSASPSATIAGNLKLDEVLSGFIPSNPFSVLVGGEMLQVVLLAIFLGIALMSLKDNEAQPLVSLLNTFQKLSMVVISWAMRLAPYAVFGLTAKLISQLGTQALFGLGIYVLTVISGLVALMVFYLLLVKVLGKQPIFEFLGEIREVLLLAFSTSSSASVMPLTIETAEKKLGVRSSISQFIIPLGTTINMGGTALYQGVATAFLAQVFQVDLSISQITFVVLTATLSAVGAPGTPGVGIAILATILTSVGIPAHGVMLIVGVDRILDMCRTVLNVAGDLVAAVIMNRFEK
ncbi:MAG: dicarboxylate/amino acid:cation symporter [Bacteriovoracaceae bacterium]|nr:dicarboxylate/amino acid:cation symporter [Bacteriovoracaceae bacterium]